MPPDFWQVPLTLGGLLAAALFAGGFAGVLRLPKVTTYLLVGVLLGPDLLNWIEQEHLELLKPLTKLAISLVLFNLGCHFPLARVRRILRRALRLSAGEMSVTFVLVGLGLPLLGESWSAALLLAALALATAPATTVLVLKETESEGPVTEYTNSLVALNNLVSILLFELLFLGIHFAEGKLAASATIHLGRLAQDVAGSLVLGVAAGLVASYCYTLVDESRRLVLLIALITLLLAVCQLRQMPYLVTFLGMGITVANSSDRTRQVLAELDRLTGLLCVVFFVVHGAELNLRALGEAGLIGLGYIVFRFSGKYFGVRLATTDGREEPAVRNWLGMALVAQAGAAIALSEIAVGRDARLGEHIQTIILGTVVVFELAGPILIRQAVLRAGEVPLAHAIRHSSVSLVDPLRTVWNRVLIALGRNPWENRSPEDLTVHELMRTNVASVSQAAPFDEVIAIVEHSRDNTYPVVSSGGELVGVIRYRELSHALFDPALGGLVRAVDLTTPARWVLHPDEPVSRAYDMLQASRDDCIPVVTREEPYRLLGLLRQRDVLRMLLRGQIDTQTGSG